MKLSYNPQLANAANYTIDPGYDVVYVTNNTAGNVNITLPTLAVNGQVLHIIWAGANNARFFNVNPDGTDYSTSGAAHLTFVYANGGWRLISVVE